MSIIIYEFSTGINPERSPYSPQDWVSKGFTGQYMNKSPDLGEIPAPVQRAIANQLFAVAEGSATKQPALVGRVVGTPPDMWSVVAIVSRGADDRGRSFSAYRYFISPGHEGLGAIVAWLKETYLNQGRALPVFNPFDSIQSYKATIRNPACWEGEAKFIENLPEKILHPQDLMPQGNFPAVHDLATQKAQLSHSEISWAFNVEALEKPYEFLVVHTASDVAFNRIQRTIANAPIQPHRAAALDEQALKSAIKGLMNSSTAKPEHIITFLDAASNQDISDSYWNTLFDSQGASNAINQKIYSAAMSRLLTLKAIVIPSSLSTFLDWVKGQEELYKASASLQKSILDSRTSLENLEPKLSDSVFSSIFDLVENPQKLESSVWLFGKYPGIWQDHYGRIIKPNLYADLRSRQRYQFERSNSFHIHDKRWINLLNKYQGYWQGSVFLPEKPEYLTVARLFTEIAKKTPDNVDISLIFYCFAYGKRKLPIGVFQELGIEQSSRIVFNVPVDRDLKLPEMTGIFLESIWNAEIYIEGNVMKLVFAIVLFFFGGMGGFFLHNPIMSLLSSDSSTNSAAQEQEEEFRKSKFNTDQSGQDLATLPTVLATPTVSLLSEVNPDAASSTYNALNQLVADLVKNYDQETERAIYTIEKIIGESYNNADLKFEDLKNNGSQWNQAIKFYQEKVMQVQAPDGIITPYGDTYRSLRCQVADRLIISLTDRSKPENQKWCSSKSNVAAPNIPPETLRN